MDNPEFKELFNRGDYVAALEWVTENFNRGNIDLITKNRLEGKCAGWLGKFDHALNCLEEAIALSPGNINPDAWDSKGIVYQMMNDGEKAIMCYDLAIEQSPDGKYHYASYGRGYLLCITGRMTEALISFQKAEQDSPGGVFPEASYAVGLCYRNLDLPEKAIKPFEKAIADSPGGHHPEAHNHKGESLLILEDYENALDAFDTAIKQSDKILPLFYYNRGFAYQKLGRYEESINSLDQAIQASVNMQYPDASFVLGNAYLKTNRFEQAIICYQKAIDDSEGQMKPESYLNMGSAFSELKKKDDALRCFFKAIEQSGSHEIAEPYYNIGLIYSQRKKFDEAILFFQKTIELSPKGINAFASFQIGISFFELQAFPESEKEFEKAIQASPGQRYPEASCAMGLSFLEQDKIPEALNAFDKAVYDSPGKKFPDASFSKGLVYMKKNMDKAAIESFQKAINDKHDNKYPDASRELGICLQQNAYLEKALAAFEKAANDSVDLYFPDAWCRKAKLLHSMGRRREAKEAAFISIGQNNKSTDCVAFINDYVNSHPAYRNRISYLNILLLQNNAGIISQWENIKQTFKNFAYINDAELFCLILLNENDVLHTGMDHYERLRWSYVIFAANKQPEWVYYTIDHLLNNNYPLDRMDYFFYLDAAASVAASEKELKTIISKAGFANITLNRVDVYLRQLKYAPERENLLQYVKNDKEKMVLQQYIAGNPFPSPVPKNEMLLRTIAGNFQTSDDDLAFFTKDSKGFLNLSDSLSKEDIYEVQVAQNIDEFIDGGSVSTLGATLFLLSEFEKNYYSNKEITEKLKAYALLKYELKKQQSKKPSIPVLTVRGLISTTIGAFAPAVIAGTFIFSVCLTIAVDFCLNVVEEKIFFDAKFTWEEFLERIANSNKIVQ